MNLELGAWSFSGAGTLGFWSLPRYSYLSASIGSSRDAFHAG